MYEQALLDGIWNRACIGQKPAMAAGDSALKAMIGFHSVAMNGGFLHLVECWLSQDLDAIKDAYRYFGFEDVSELISTAQAALQQGADLADLEVIEETLERKYDAEIPDDATLVVTFEAHYKSSPESYAPLAED